MVQCAFLTFKEMVCLKYPAICHQIYMHCICILAGMVDHWCKDEGSESCVGCGVRFTIYERRHHCRACGRLFCSSCSQYQGRRANSIDKSRPEFWLEKSLEFWLILPTLRNCSKMNSLDMSQNQNGISIRFFKPKLKPNCFLLNCLPVRDTGAPDSPEGAGLQAVPGQARGGQEGD